MNALTLEQIREAQPSAVARPNAVLLAAEKLWRAGMTRDDIAARLGLSTHRLRRTIERNRDRFPQRYEIRQAPMGRKLSVPPAVVIAPQVEKPFRPPVDYEPGLSRYLCEPAPARIPGEPIGLMQLTAHTCRWPVNGDARPMLFCGGHFDFTGSYCEEHRKKAFTPRTAERGRA